MQLAWDMLFSAKPDLLDYFKNHIFVPTDPATCWLYYSKTLDLYKVYTRIYILNLHIQSCDNIALLNQTYNTSR